MTKNTSSGLSSLAKMMSLLKEKTTQTSVSVIEAVTRLPTKMGWTTPPSRFAEEKRSMDNARRDLEQSGHRKLGVKVHALERIADEQPLPEAGLEVQSTIETNPLLADNQRFDGIDPTVNPEPALNSEARREFDNERREQELEKQLRLGNMPQMGRQFNPRPERR